MANCTEETFDQMKCAVELVPDVVDAGATMTLICAVSSSPIRDLRGRSLIIKDHNGAMVGNAHLTEYDGQTNKTSKLTVHAPVKAGEYTWSATLLGNEEDDGPNAEISTPFSFIVKSHTTSVIAWDVPSAIVVGERFTIKVGIKCSSQCRLTGQEFAIHDHEGRQVAKGTLGSEPWKGTAALYFGDINLLAPDAEGLFQWMVKVKESELEVPATGGTLPHGGGSVAFGVRFVSRPQYLVSVEAFDALEQTPLAGARVVMHPYRASTNENGIAEVKVAEGGYKLFVTQTGYVTVSIPVDVKGDLTTRAELYLEPEVVRE